MGFSGICSFKSASVLGEYNSAMMEIEATRGSSYIVKQIEMRKISPILSGIIHVNM